MRGEQALKHFIYCLAAVIDDLLAEHLLLPVAAIVRKRRVAIKAGRFDFSPAIAKMQGSSPPQ
jgi:hypothetical protein